MFFNWWVHKCKTFWEGVPNHQNLKSIKFKLQVERCSRVDVVGGCRERRNIILSKGITNRFKGSCCVHFISKN